MFYANVRIISFYRQSLHNRRTSKAILFFKFNNKYELTYNPNITNSNVNPFVTVYC